MTCRRCSSWPILLFVAIGVGVLAYRGLSSGVAPMPPAFEDAPTLDVALDRARDSGTPVLAFATADWCGPCQALKRGALADAEVSRIIAERTVPAYVDLTDSSDPEAAEAARLLRIRSIPALVLIEDGKEVGRLEGGVGASELHDWLEGAVDR